MHKADEMGDCTLKIKGAWGVPGYGLVPSALGSNYLVWGSSSSSDLGSFVIPPQVYSSSSIWIATSILNFASFNFDKTPSSMLLLTRLSPVVIPLSL